MSEKKKDSVLWVRFEDEAAKLCRLRLNDGRIGLLLAYEPTKSGKEINQRALERGFEEVSLSSVEHASCFVPADKNFPFTVRELAQALGGEAVRISREEMENNSFPKAKDAIQENKMREEEGADMANVEDVVRDEELSDDDAPIRIVISDNVADEVSSLLDGETLSVDDVKQDAATADDDQMEIQF